MTEPVVSMEAVYKKFSRGERHDSLRDLIPALAKKVFGRAANGSDVLKEREFWALNNVSFALNQGEAVGVIGHNGAGKSTMLKHLSGILQPTSGAVKIKGRLAALIEVGAGFHQDLTGRENIFLNGVILGMSRNEVRRKFDEIVEFSGLADFIDTPVKRYSSGMYARLGFSVAAHMEPEILIIDEVLSVGDVVFQAKGVEKMRSVLKSGATVIFVSHNLRSIADLCPRSLLMNKGRLVEDGPTSAVIRSYMEQVRVSRPVDDSVPVKLSKVEISGSEATRYDFWSGESAAISITFKATKRVERVSCYVIIQDEKFYDVFATNSERLGQEPLTLEPGQEVTCTFDLTLHLAPGSYYVTAGVARNDVEKIFDSLQPAATIFIKSEASIRGSANLYPKLSCRMIGNGSSP